MPDYLSARAVSIVPPVRPLRGRVAPPGSKSITNRALLLAALARGTSRLDGALKSDDTARMAEALAAMGVEIAEPDATTFVVTGTGRLKAPAQPLFLGNAGTATRFLTAATALVDGTVVVDGDAHMRKRPIAPLIEALTRLGVVVEAPTGCPPVDRPRTRRVRGPQRDDRCRAVQPVCFGAADACRLRPRACRRGACRREDRGAWLCRPDACSDGAVSARRSRRRRMAVGQWHRPAMPPPTC